MGKLIDLESMKNRIKPWVPKKIKCLGRTLYKRTECLYVDLLNTLRNEHPEFNRLPPAYMRYSVAQDTDLNAFLKCGKRSSGDIETALKTIGRDLPSFKCVLDFGCGCGRTLLWFEKYSKSITFHGSDIRADLIDWCRNNITFCTFNANKPLPPLEYRSESFDLIYALSVFTHLDENYQFQWLEELKRILQPKGILLLTVHGEFAWKDFPPEVVSRIKKEGFLFLSDDYWKYAFPSWYQSTEHTKDYILRRYAEYFDILGYIPQGMNEFQDVVILQKR